MRSKIACMLVLLVVFSCASALAEMSVDEIVGKANLMSYYQGQDGRAQVSMEITDSQGRTRQRELVILRYDVADGAGQKYYVYFLKPNDVKGMAYIVWKKLETDDDRWLYLPALDLVRRIAASDKRSSFAGTNFLYEDISGRSVALDDHELVSSEGASYRIKNTPKDADMVEFSYYEVSVDKETFIPMQADYYDKQGKLYRQIEVLEVEEIQGYPTITSMKATDLNADASTVSTFSKVEYDIGLDEEVFTERYLRRPPMQYLQQ